MKLSLLPLLACPECRGDIVLAPEFAAPQQQDAEIDDVLLKCEGCGRHFPVIAEIPRMLPDNLMDTVRANYPEVFEKYANRSIGAPGGEISKFLTDTRRTSRSFGYQWNVFSAMYEDWEENFKDYVKPLEPEFFKGKLGLDMGCGFGRHLYWSGTYGARMVGVDLSQAVLSAHRNTRHLPHVNVVQGDIYNLPLKDAAFDFGYSIGVIHHLPDPRGGFGRLVRKVRPGGTVFAWVYGVRRGPVEWLSVALRKLTTRMPLKMLYILCWIIAVFLRIFSHYPYRVLSRIGPAKGLAERLPIKDHARYPFQVTVADAFDRLSVPLVQYYNEPEFRKWFEEEGLDGIRILRRFKNNESWRGVAVVPPVH